MAEDKYSQLKITCNCSVDIRCSLLQEQEENPQFLHILVTDEIRFFCSARCSHTRNTMVIINCKIF